MNGIGTSRMIFSFHGRATRYSEWGRNAKAILLFPLRLLRRPSCARAADARYLPGMRAAGPEFISKDLDRWAYWNHVELDFSRPGKPSDNAPFEAFNSRFRQECLNQHWFMSLEDARGKLAAWQQEYKTERPHSSLGYRSPVNSDQ